MPKLEELYLANNNITGLAGYDGLTALKKLHLRRNKIDKIEEELPELPALEYLNLRSNKIPDMKNLVNLFQFKTLVDLNVINSPVELGFSSMNVFVAEVLIVNPKMTRFCKVEIGDPNKLEAVFLAKYQHTKKVEEEKRIAEEERKKAEAEEGEG